MLDFIVKYWVQELFGLLIVIGGVIGKTLWKRYKKGRDAEREEYIKAHDDKFMSMVKEFGLSIADRVDKRIDLLEKSIENLKSRNDNQDENITILKSGVLSLQRQQFLDYGKKLLAPDHIIIYDEFMYYTQLHKTYNNLGGNHEGDAQFALVEKKYHSGLENKNTK